jgi:hypothetical protein
MNLLRFLRITVHAYFQAKKHGAWYCAASNFAGVPQVCIFVGVGRDAWRISQRAIEEAML